MSYFLHIKIVMNDIFYKIYVQEPCCSHDGKSIMKCLLDFIPCYVNICTQP